MERVLRIGEYQSLGMMPFYYPLRHIFNRPEWRFVRGQPDELTHYLKRGELDISPATPLVLDSDSLDYLVLPHLGYGGYGHIRDMLFFSDLLLDDMDEMTVSLTPASSSANTIINLVLSHYLRYQNEFITGWGNAEGHVLAGDPALRERSLNRYAYVYDLGELWRHYTGKHMVYYIWVVRKTAFYEKEDLVRQFVEALQKSVELAASDWQRLARLLEGYDWLKKSSKIQLWTSVDYKLKEEHFEGLARYYEDCVEAGIIEESPEINYLEVKSS